MNRVYSNNKLHIFPRFALISLVGCNDCYLYIMCIASNNSFQLVGQQIPIAYGIDKEKNNNNNNNIKMMNNLRLYVFQFDKHNQS